MTTSGAGFQAFSSCRHRLRLGAPPAAYFSFPADRLGLDLTSLVLPSPCKNAVEAFPAAVVAVATWNAAAHQ
jgi:hypothetical protein